MVSTRDADEDPRVEGDASDARTAPAGIGLCLSGGGFRASFYGLGVLRYLAEAGLLSRVAAISSISGGSIAAAMLADRWTDVAARGYGADAFLAAADGPFRRVVTTKNLRNIWIRRWLTRPWRDRGAVQGSVLGDRLFRTKYLADLPHGLQTVITSTDLATGRAFRFCRDFIGSYDFGYASPPSDLQLGTAVAASAAFPFVFPPVHIRTQGLGLSDLPPVFSLTDGGVYDNLGLEWFQGWMPHRRPAGAVKPDFLVIADASGRFQPTNMKVGELKAIKRVRGIQYRQTTSVRIRWLMEDFNAGKRRGIYVAAVGDPRQYTDTHGNMIDAELHDGALDSALAGMLASLRTDLDRFLPEEADLLSYHGYWSTHARLGTHHPHLAVSQPSWRQFADLDPVEIERLRKILIQGTRHFGPGRYWG